MPKKVNIDEEDATLLSRLLVPFTLLIIFTLLIEEYWGAMEDDIKVTIIVILLGIATFAYRDNIRGMIYD